MLLAGHERVGRLAAAEQDAVARLGEVGGEDRVAVVAHRDDRRLVHEVREVGAREAGCRARDHIEIDVVAEVLAARVHRQDRRALAEVGQRDLDLAIEPAGAQQRGIERLRPVRRREHHDARRRVEAVHLREHLVERLLAFVVRHQRAAAPLADRVDLVDEDDRGRGLAGREQVADPRRAHPDEHLHEARARQREERNVGLARDGPRQQRLAGSRAGRPSAHRAAPPRPPPRSARVLEEVDDLADLALGAFVAGHVGEPRLRPLLVVDLRLRGADAHQAARERWSRAG